MRKIVFLFLLFFFMLSAPVSAQEIGSYEIPLSIAVSPMNADNACLAAKYLDGVTVAPGEEFSFNTSVGMRTTDRGFTSGYIASQSRNEKAVGGGVCMTASILHQAVKSAGLQVLERHNHCIQISYLPLGEDAAVQYGVEDFRFKNSLGMPLVIHSTIGETLRISITEEDKPIQVYHDAQLLKFDTPPFIQNDCLLVPINTIADSMDGQVSWDPSLQTVSFNKGEFNIRFTIGSTRVLLNGQEKVLDIPTQTINDRTMVPLRFVAEALGGIVNWDPISQTAFITTKIIPAYHAGLQNTAVSWDSLQRPRARVDGVQNYFPVLANLIQNGWPISLANLAL
ncbi:MAG TPA: VanW family protein [Syntrophomonadaceae bacterium]|nr:VanW family protein [Syntrophomonadaceae bacterium]